MKTLGDDLLISLRELKDEIIKIIKEQMDGGKIFPEEEPCIRWKWEGYQYTSEGIKTSKGSTEDFIKKSWWHSIHELMAIVSKTRQFQTVQDNLSTIIINKDSIPQATYKYSERLVQIYLETLNLQALEYIVNSFYDEAKTGNFKSIVRVEIIGAILNFDMVDISNDITLYKTTEKDIEYEIAKEYQHNTWPIFHHPTVILKQNFINISQVQLQQEIEKSIVLLRLFKVGSVDDISYRTDMDSFLSILIGSLHKGSIQRPILFYEINPADITRLKKYWLTFKTIIPLNFYDFITPKNDSLVIAYIKYKDALALTAMIENQIATTIAGIEALILENDAELQYRISLRVAKLMGLIGDDSSSVRNIMKIAYAIRSTFAHGSFFSENEKKKLEKKGVPIKQIALKTMDYLRSLILIIILTKYSKRQLIDGIEKSILDTKVEELLKKDLMPIIDVIR